MGMQQQRQSQQHTIDETAHFVLREALTAPEVQSDDVTFAYRSGVRSIIQGVLVGIADLVGAIAFTFLATGTWHQALSALAAWLQILLWLAALGIVVFVAYKAVTAMADGYIAYTHANELLLDRRAKRQRQNQLTDASVTVMTSTAQMNYAEAQRLIAEAEQKKYSFAMSDDQGNALVRNPETGQFELLTGNMRSGITSYHYNSSATGGTKVQEEAAPQIGPVHVPTGRELLENGEVEKALAEGLIILGMTETGQLAKLKIKKCFSTLVSGLPSVGKSTTVFWIIGQLVLIGARIWIIDPHIYFQDEEGNKSLAAELSDLADSFVFPPCDDEQFEVIRRVKFMYDELIRRKKPGYIVRAKDTIIGVMDEFNTIADSMDPDLIIVRHEGKELNFAQTLALIEREGRKFGLHFMLIGHKWTRQDIGGDNAVRTNATTYLCHKLNDQRQADLLLGSGEGKKILKLTVGSYWITGPTWNEEPAKITTPNISARDLPLLREIKQRGVRVIQEHNVVDSTAIAISDEAMEASPLPSPETISEDVSEDDRERCGKLADTTTGVLLDQAQKIKLLQVLEMDSQQKGQNEMIRTIWGVEPSSRAGNTAAEELRLIRAYIAQEQRKSIGL